MIDAGQALGPAHTPSERHMASDSNICSPTRLSSLNVVAVDTTGREPAFDRATRLATRILGVPVSLVSFVTHDRQVLKGKTGDFAPDETPLSHSFCKHVVDTGGPLVVRDARDDPRVQRNEAITDYNVISYLGVPIRDPEGQVLGSLCGIGETPRDWNEDDRANLEDIAAGVEAEIAARSSAARERSHRQLFQTMMDELPLGIALAEVPSGALSLLNAAALDIMCETELATRVEDYARYGAEHPDGRSYRAEEYPLARAVSDGEAVRDEPMILRRGPNDTRTLLVSAERIPTSPPLAVATFVDATDQLEAHQELTARDRRIQGFHDLSGDSIIDVDADDRILWANDRFTVWLREEFGEGAADDPVGRPLADVVPQFRGATMREELRRTREERSLMNHDLILPTGRTVEVRVSADETGSLMIYLRDVSEARRLAEARDMLTRELNHRVKNLFAIVSGMVGMTARTAATPAEMATSLRQRIQALSRAHDLIRPAITAEDADGASEISIAALASSIVSPHLHHRSDRVCFEGEAVMLSPYGSTNLALVFHELATNAAKYGALSEPSGSLRVEWRSEGAELVVDWIERGGPVAAPPSQTGFGSTLLGMIVEGQLCGTLERDWGADGLTAVLRLPLALIDSRPGVAAA